MSEQVPFIFKVITNLDEATTNMLSKQETIPTIEQLPKLEYFVYSGEDRLSIPLTLY